MDLESSPYEFKGYYLEINMSTSCGFTWLHLRYFQFSSVNQRRKNWCFSSKFCILIVFTQNKHRLRDIIMGKGSIDSMKGKDFSFVNHLLARDSKSEAKKKKKKNYFLWYDKWNMKTISGESLRKNIRDCFIWGWQRNWSPKKLWSFK